MIPRTLQSTLLRLAGLFPVLSLTGPRQSGKTTLIKSTFPDYAYLNLENLDTRTAAIEDPRTFLLAPRDRGVIIDEAQKAPELFSYLQQIVDESGAMGKYILTGSQNFLLLESITQSLAGRVAINHLLPFHRRELPAALRPGQLDRALFMGAYPAIFDRAIPPRDYYPSYLQTYIERDVRAIKNIGNLNTFRRFLRICAGRIGQLLNLSSIGAEIGIDAKTVRNWLSILEASFIIFLLPPYFRNFNKRVIKHPKLYFLDTGLACSLLGLTAESQLENMYLRGNLFENYIISEYLKSVRHLGAIPNIYFWRDSTGTEIDLVIDLGHKLVAVEIKSGATIMTDFFAGLKAFCRYSGITPDDCFLVHGGDSSMKRRDGMALSWQDTVELPSGV